MLYMKQILSFCIFLFALPLFAWAQLAPEDISLRVVPELPEPGQEVSLDIESYVTDLSRSQITWILDGNEIEKGVGEIEVTFNVGSVGTVHSLQVIAQTPDNGTIVKTISISPASVDLLWEAVDSYTPKLYKGKAQNAHDSGVIILAMPYFIDKSGNQINPKSLVYNWKVNNKPQQGASGFGKDSFTFSGPSLYRDSFITVDVESPDNAYRARRSINLSAQSPKVLFYTQNPLYGERLLDPIAGGSLQLEEDELIIRAEPYFFSDINNSEVADYEWRIDGKKILTVGDRNLITLRRPEKGSGRSSVSLEIKHIGKLLQFARESFTALFEEREERASANSGDTNFFGN